MSTPAPPRFRLGQLLAVLFILSGMLVAAAAVAGTLTYRTLLHDRADVLDRVDPADGATSALLAGYLDQETGVRGYVLSGQKLFLEPYMSGQEAVASATRRLDGLLHRDTDRRILDRVTATAGVWSRDFAVPAVAAVESGDSGFATDAVLSRGKADFDALRAAIAALHTNLAAERQAARHDLAVSTDRLTAVMVAALVIIVINGGLIWVALRRLVVRPVAEVVADARVVTSGQLDHAVEARGPREVFDLATEIEAMRTRIVEEAVAARASESRLTVLNEDLARSNQDLEQFAYVASHDLQEPLRKVTSFCQLLEQRYGGQLDERGEQYIAFAVDGAKRMQVLINDLLALSRIGRTTDRFEPIRLQDTVDAALRNLSISAEESGASIVADPDLPVVWGDRSLLIALLQNLLGNAMKFHGDEPPVIRVAAEALDDDWMLSVTDNGIGIEARFAERIFIIFQRLHGRDAYTGTGIGLSLCRKIVEFHGGRIWLDTGYERGTRFYFTLPRVPSEE